MECTQKYIKRGNKMNDVRIRYFSATWCGPCKAYKPVIKKLKKAGYPIDMIDIDKDPILAESYRIMSVPTIKITKDDKVVESMVGVQSPDALLTKLHLHYPVIINSLSEIDNNKKKDESEG